MPAEENCSPVRGRVWVKVNVSFRVGEQPDNCSEENCPLVRFRSWVRVSFGVGWQFFLEAIVLEPKTRLTKKKS